MVNWSDPDEIARDAAVFERLTFTLFGVYTWELFVTWDFELSLLRRRKKFRWPLVFFFLCRYCMLLALIGLIMSLTVATRINCGALFTFNSWTGNMSILCASTSLMLRTVALWDRKRQIIIALGVLCLAHWALLYRTMFIVTASWSDTAKTCVVTGTSPSLLNTTFFFTMGFDLIILLFTAAALLKKHSARTDLWKLLFQDGLIYFLVSFTMNSVPAVLNILNLNTPMNVVATIPAATVTSVASSRAVIRLLEFSPGEVYVHSIPAVTNSHPTRQSGAPYAIPKSSKYTKRPEVHVTTEHLTMAEFPPSTPASPYSKNQDRRTSSVNLRSTRDTEGHSTEDEKETYAFSQSV